MHVKSELPIGHYWKRLRVLDTVSDEPRQPLHCAESLHADPMEHGDDLCLLGAFARHLYSDRRQRESVRRRIGAGDSAVYCRAIEPRAGYSGTNPPWALSTALLIF